MHKIPFILIILFLVSIFIASAQFENLPAPPATPGFEEPELVPAEPSLPVEQTPQVTVGQDTQQLQAQVASMKATLDTLNKENIRLKEEMRLMSERKPRATTFFYIVFFLSLAVNIVLIVMYIMKYTKHHPEEQPMSSFTRTFQPESKPIKKAEPQKSRDIEELKEYLTNAAKQGFTFDEVHEMLKKSGWPEDLIEKAYDEIQHGL